MLAETTRVCLFRVRTSLFEGRVGHRRRVADVPGPRAGRRCVVRRRSGSRRGDRCFERHVQLPPTWAVDRSMTWSMNPYSWASSAVNHRSRSESASIRSIGWPVWKAIRSAIIRLR